MEKREFSELSLPPVSVRAAVREANSENGAGQSLDSLYIIRHILESDFTCYLKVL